jgi:hypothetical protein
VPNKTTSSDINFGLTLPSLPYAGEIAARVLAGNCG